MGESNVLITGANRGIGLEFVRQYRRQGAQVYACCRDPQSAQDLKQLAEGDPNIEIVQLDVNSSVQLGKLKQRFAERPLNIVINNAGVYGPRKVGDPVDRDGWHSTFETNVMGPVDVAFALQPSLRRSKGVLANVTSRMGSIADNDSGGSHIYRSSKAALNAAMKSVAVDWQEAGITVLLLHPGWVETAMGGPNALISTETSVRGMIAVIGNADSSDSGTFVNYQGDKLPW